MARRRRADNRRVRLNGLARLTAATAIFVALAVGCGGGDSPDEQAAPSPASDAWGVYPADTSLDEKAVVAGYVAALDERDGEAFCRLVAPWISGRFDLAGTDPDEQVTRPLRCPQVVPALTDFPWENQERVFEGASVAAFGELERRGDLVSVPVTITMRWKESERGAYEEPLEDVVWLTRDADAWRVAKLGLVATAAALAQGTEQELRAPPDVEAERRTFAAEVEKARSMREAREASYRDVGGTASCQQGKAYPDPAEDVVDYRHPAPASPTPQLPAADLRGLHVDVSGDRICVFFELAGDVETGTTFEFAVESRSFEWGRAGFTQGFEVELRADGRARVTSGQNDERRPIAVPADVGLDENRFMLAVNAASFLSGRPFPGSVAPYSALTEFQLRADVTHEVSEVRLLHDDLGPGPPEGAQRFPYP
jgi:hypothetical protein